MIPENKNVWFRLYDKVYGFLRENFGGDLGVCPYGTQCKPGGWDCCSGIWKVNGVAVTALPHEDEWLRLYGEDLPKGCKDCAYRKSLVCSLAPVMPFPLASGAWALKLILNCEALVAVPWAYEKHIELAEFMAKTIALEFPEIMAEYVIAADRCGGASRTSIVCRAEPARRLLGTEQGRQVMKALLEIAPHRAGDVDGGLDEIKKHVDLIQLVPRPSST